VSVPAALPAIITAVFLGIARVAGETAPLLLTASNNAYWPRSLNDYTPSLPVFIFGVFLAPLGGMWLATWTGLAGQMAYNVAGAAMLVSVATVAAVAKKPRPRPISS